MKKDLVTAFENFFGITALLCLLDLFAARFDTARFTQIITQPGHITFAVVLGLILAAGAFARPRRMQAA